MSRPRSRRPACGRPLQLYALNRPREQAGEPVCGKGQGHKGNCVSAESLERRRRVRAERRRRGD